MKKVVLIALMLIMGGVTDAIAVNNDVAQQEHVEKRRKKKRKSKSKISNQHGWKIVSTGRTCNKKKRRH